MFGYYIGCWQVEKAVLYVVLCARSSAWSRELLEIDIGGSSSTLTPFGRITELAPAPALFGSFRFLQSTGVYWIPVFELLEEKGFEVKLVEPGKLKVVPGRKTDVLDCQWIQQLHPYGLLSGSFHPESEIGVLRSYMRQRSMLVNHASQHVLHMQKALMQMNLQLHHVIADITGATGLRILDAITTKNNTECG